MSKRHSLITSLIISFIAQSTFAESTAPPPERANQQAIYNARNASQDAPPPVRANQQASPKTFSTWDLQFLYGSSFREPGVSNVVKRIVTLENSSGWAWGSSYFFIDYLRSNASDANAAEFYGEWYPSLSLSWVTKKPFCTAGLNDVLLTLGVNAGAKTTGGGPLVFLPGFTFNLKIPFFQFFSLGTYAYIEKGRLNQYGNGCNSTSYQITPSWSLPFNIGQASFRFDGFIDYIGSHGLCAYQIVSQPTVKLDVGNFFNKPNLLLAGVEWSYWRNKYGISNLTQTAPQAVVMFVMSNL